MAITRPHASQILFGDRRLDRKLGDLISPQDSPFNAVCDGVTNDTAAMQAFITYLATFGGRGVLPNAPILITSSLTLPVASVPFSLSGTGSGSILRMRNTTSAGSATVLAFIGPTGVTVSDLTLDCGYSVTGFASHGFSFRNARNCTVRGVRVLDHRNAAGLMFVSSEDEQWQNCHIINCSSESNGYGQNGFLHEGMHYSSIQNCDVAPLDMAGSPCVALQLKNKCRHSYIQGGTVRGSRAGVAFGGDGATFGDGPHNCFVDGVIIKDCLDAGIFGKSTDCWVRYHADMTNSPAPTALEGHAFNVAGSNINLRGDVTIKGVQAGRTAMRIRSNDVSVRVPYANGIGDKLAILGAGVNRCRILLDDAADTISNIAGLVTDNSGNTTNEILFLRDLPVGGLAGTATIRFPTTAGVGNWLAWNGTQFIVRGLGADMMAINPAWISPASDNVQSAGRAAARYTELYAATGTINTSDEREKQDIEAIPDAWLDAWASVDFVRYRWKSAVAAKGEDARWHVGLVAQHVRDAFAAYGLDATEIGLLCYDQWPEQRDDDGNVTIEAGERWGLRMDQCLIMEAALLRRTAGV